MCPPARTPHHWLQAMAFSGRRTLPEPTAFKAGVSSQHVGGPKSYPEAEEWGEMVTAVRYSDAGIRGRMSGVFFFTTSMLRTAALP